jgi:uncharacterized protein YbjT (DUF2867 family)
MEEPMILVVGATGTLGVEICQRLSQRHNAVRALARQTADQARLGALRDAGVEIFWGDLKDPESLTQACRGVDVVISTASSTLSRQSGDSIETVDRLGQIALIEAARQAGVRHFTFVSIPRNPVHESPLTRAKAQAERALIESGMTYTILAANFFMEIWLSPALGFDYPHRKAVIFGDGQAPMSWISYHDVAEFAVRSHLVPGARNRMLEIGGPQDLSPLDVIQRFERMSESPFERQFISEQALRAQMEQAADPLSESFAKLQLEYAHGCVMDSSLALALMPMEMATVGKYAASVCGQAVPSAS